MSRDQEKIWRDEIYGVNPDIHFDFRLQLKNMRALDVSTSIYIEVHGPLVLYCLRLLATAFEVHPELKVHYQNSPRLPVFPGR